MANIKLVEAWEEKCGKCPVGFTCGTVAMRKCYINLLREREKLINGQIAREYIKRPDYGEAHKEIIRILGPYRQGVSRLKHSQADRILKHVGITKDTVKGGGG